MTLGVRSPIRPYESPAMQASLGPALRPGGLTLTRRALALCLLPREARILDAGCGRGASLELLRGFAGYHAVGLDPSLSLLAEASGRGPVLAGRAEALPFLDGAFDAVLCECALSLIPDRDAALAEFARVLAPDGCLIVSDIYRKNGPESAAFPLDAGGCLDGAEPLETTFARIERAGLDRTHFELRDKDLKELAARLILAHGSLDAFWEAVSGPSGPNARCAIRAGYYLLIAQKDGPP